MAKKPGVDHVDIFTFLREHRYPENMKDKGEKTNFRRATKHYVLLNNVMYYVLNGVNREVIFDEKRRREIITACHEGRDSTIPPRTPSGHRGRDACLNRITTSFYWRNIRRDVSNVISSCQSCFKFNNSRKQIATLKILRLPTAAANMDPKQADVTNPAQFFWAAILTDGCHTNQTKSEVLVQKTVEVVAQFLHTCSTEIIGLCRVALVGEEADFVLSVSEVLRANYGSDLIVLHDMAAASNDTLPHPFVKEELTSELIDCYESRDLDSNVNVLRDTLDSSLSRPVSFTNNDDQERDGHLCGIINATSVKASNDTLPHPFVKEELTSELIDCYESRNLDSNVNVLRDTLDSSLSRPISFTNNDDQARDGHLCRIINATSVKEETLSPVRLHSTATQSVCVNGVATISNTQRPYLDLARRCRNIRHKRAALHRRIRLVNAQKQHRVEENTTQLSSASTQNPPANQINNASDLNCVNGDSLRAIVEKCLLPVTDALTRLESRMSAQELKLDRCVHCIDRLFECYDSI